MKNGYDEGDPRRAAALLELSTRVFQAAESAGLGSAEGELELLRELAHSLRHGIESLSGESTCHTAECMSLRQGAKKERSRLEAELLQARKLEALGLLTGGIAHDFNNMLTVISSYASFAIEDLPESSPVRDDILKVKEAGDRAATLVGQLLAFSRRQVMEPEPLDLDEVVVGLRDMLQRLLGESINVLVMSSGDLGRVVADRGQIEQVIMNLAVNARDAMPDGGRLIVETSNVEIDETLVRDHVGMKQGSHVMLTFSDTGMGMTEETRMRIFEPFFTTKERGKGTGLGLPTAYGIIEQSGGSIHVESAPHEGTTFRIYLPISDDTVCRVAPAPVPTVARGTETVLVVEDEEGVLALADRALRKAGYRVLLAANAGEALLLCERHRAQIHLLITDVVLPHMSGKELADRLVSFYSNIRILYMSGYADDTIARHGVVDPSVMLLPKPFEAKDLLVKVRRALDREF